MTHLDEKALALEAAVLAHDKEEAAMRGEPDPWGDDRPEQEFSDRIFAMELAIRAYIAALPSSSVSELVERLDTCAVATFPIVQEAASTLTTLTTLSTRNAELEREVKRLREAVGLLETANSLRRNSSSDVVYEDYYDGPKVEDLEDQAHTLSTSPQGADHE